MPPARPVRKEDNMKKALRIALALMLTLALLFAAGCSGKGGNESGNAPAGTVPDFGEGVTYISDALYYTYYLAFTTNSDEYNGKKYAVDGMFHLTKFEGGETMQIFRYHREVDPADGKEFAYYRGFMLRGDKVPADTPEKAWIRVVGTLNSERHDDHYHVFLDVESFELLDTPGQEYVE